ncbi:MAG: hypothetical protein AB8F74_09995, partial [Saprospiraceae bacterium]
MKTNNLKGRDNIPKHFPLLIFVLSNGLYLKINPEELLFVCSQKNTITIYVSEKAYEVKTSLRKLLKILPGNK